MSRLAPLPEYVKPSFHPPTHPSHADRNPKAKSEYRRPVVNAKDITFPGFNLSGDASVLEKFNNFHFKPTALTSTKIDYASLDDPNAAIMIATAPSVGLINDELQALLSPSYNPLSTLRSQAAADMNSIVQNIVNNGQTAFVDVYYGDQVVAISGCETGTMFAYSTALSSEHAIAANLGDTRYAYATIIGSYSATSGFIGISQYVLTNVYTIIPALILAGLFTALIRNLIVSGVDMAFSELLALAADYLINAGFEAITIVTVTVSLATATVYLTFTFVGILIYFAIDLVMTYLVKKYILVIDTYNFDSSSEWDSGTNDYTYNGTIDSGSYCQAGMQAFVAAGSSYTPPWFKPGKPAQNVLSYISYTYTNPVKFMTGLKVALSFTRKTDNTSFAIKYNLPWAFDNQIGIVSPAPSSLSAYLDDASSWLPGTCATVSANGVNILAKTDNLTGGKYDVYHYTITIGNSTTTADSQSNEVPDQQK